jgi:dCMP deaminase
MKTQEQFDRVMLRVAQELSALAECPRRSVATVLVDARRRVLAYGFNSRAAGHEPCDETNPCTGHWLPRGKGLGACEAIHSEIAALIQCHDPDSINTAYVTVSPCAPCARALLNAGCRRVVFNERCTGDDAAMEAWFRAPRYGAEWVFIDPVNGVVECDRAFNPRGAKPTEPLTK